MNQNTLLLLCALFAVVGLVVLIARFKVNAFVALILAALFVGVSSSLNLAPEDRLLHLQGIGKAFAEGVGNILASIAMVVGLGTILGKLLAESGGAEVIAHRLISKLGPERLPRGCAPERPTPIGTRARRRGAPDGSRPSRRRCRP